MTSNIIDNCLNNNNKVRTIYLSRHGESLNNLFGKIGGDAELSQRGWQYAEALVGFFGSRPVGNIWTSELKRTQQTIKYMDSPKTVESGVNEINAGEHDSMTYEEIAESFPTEFALRDKDKLMYRYPDGESYMDVVDRLEGVMKRISYEDNLLIISHQATLRCLLGLLHGTKLEELPYIQVPLHTVIELRFDGVQVEVINHRVRVDCVDTHRAKPDNCEINRDTSEACLTVPGHL